MHLGHFRVAYRPGGASVSFPVGLMNLAWQSVYIKGR